MDQRIESERRQEIGQEADAATGEVRKDRSWVERLRRRRAFVLLIAVLIIVAIVAIVLWRVTASGYVSTDDAFIFARSIPVSSQLNAAVVDVPVTDNQLVGAGAVLVRLDDRDYKVQVDHATGQLHQAESNLTQIKAQVGAQQARIDQAGKQAAQALAALTFAQQQNARYQNLVRKGAATVEQGQQYRSSLLEAQASLAAAQANTIAAEKQRPVLQAQQGQAEAQIEQARATLEQAEIDLSRTVITAPVAGRVAGLTAAKGKYASVGDVLMMFVPRTVWVTANFKETVLGDIHPGEPVAIEVDAYPDRVFKGHVASIQPGSGTAFSLLPAENATGNYVKIVQRVPVKIVFDHPPSVLLGPGMSVVPTVKTG
ncbi:MAG TPA: HlyD family secretion protein [Bradyrhizobium sp.]|nr:HlyD family secretion protein [Bradyrhizobium sp.]